MIPEEERTEYLCQVNAQLGKDPFAFLEHKLRQKNGHIIHVLCFGRRYYDSAARTGRSEIIITDIANTYSMRMIADAERNKAQLRLKYWEHTYRRDSMTGLLNHAAFKSDVDLKLLEDKNCIIMLMMDVDKFKEYNDTYGHHAGDEYLILVAQTLLESLRKEDLACRMGGDEFAAALFFNKTSPDTVIHERVRQIFDKLNMTVRAIDGGTGISMGAAIADQKTHTFNQLYEIADKALYQSKEKGRGCLTFADSEDTDQENKE